MKNTVYIMIKKELARFFGDRRTVFSTLILPGLLIFLVYNIMGNAIAGDLDGRKDTQITCYASGLPDVLEEKLQSANFKIIHFLQDTKKLADAKNDLTNQKIDLVLVFPKDFEKQVADYTAASGKPAPSVDIFYNASHSSSLEAFESATQMLNDYESSMTNKFDINSSGKTYDLSTEEDSVAVLFSSMLPMLLMIFLFSGTLSIAPESIAGEKERGTIATLLVTPVKRRDIAIGKILSVSFLAVLSGLSSTLGTIFSLPALLKQSGETVGSAAVYTLSDYVLLAVTIILSALVMVTVVSLLSAFAKSVKEAQTLAAPLVIVNVLIGMTAMFGGNGSRELYYYCIPLYNSLHCMTAIFKFQAEAFPILITVVSNLLVTFAGVFILTKIFQSEKIVCC